MFADGKFDETLKDSARSTKGGFEAIPVKPGEHVLWICRYVERNALRARLVDDASSWRWCSLWQRCGGDAGWLAEWPTPRPSDWVTHVNAPQTEGELQAFRTAVRRGEPFGGEEWRQAMVEVSTQGRRGRPPRARCPL
jgi:putative transposase